MQTSGYETCFIYGGRGYFDNMNAFFSGNGYDVVDQTSTSSDEIGFVNAWGMSDEDLYRQAVKAADNAWQHGKPFFFSCHDHLQPPALYLSGKPHRYSFRAETAQAL